MVRSQFTPDTVPGLVGPLGRGGASAEKGIKLLLKIMWEGPKV